ncbi:alpha/beta fold hydrolase [Streptacidiphilus carbonis]|uniref:alpha/beta fold hydrolase n=1 Tax=Streptacidiphilus carbonis TaxID=105422 RepID=UPI000693B445|nr:alpha/beta hydrolase [Streptacidiphilus carbonis]
MTTAIAISSVAASCTYLLPASAQASSLPMSGSTTVGATADTHYTPPAIAWSTCTNGLQYYGAECGFLVVPLDYADPDGTKIKIAVSRIAHTAGADAYQGALVVNLSSAGGSALGQSTVGSALPAAISGDYDWIGFDPRGVGASQPALSCDPTVNSYNRPAYRPTSWAQLNTWMQASKNYSAACAKTHSELLTHVTTTDSAKDLDSLRKALGQSRLNYYGYTYGAYLGEVYSTMYPTRVRRMILDSSIDPKQAWLGFNFAQNAPLEQNLSAFSAWAAKYDSVYHLGTTKAAVEKQYYATLAKLTKSPAGGVLGPDVWTDEFLLAYNTSNWEDLAGVFSAYVNTGNSAPMKTLYDANYTTTNDNAFAMSLATECTDASWPKSWGSWLWDTWKSYRKAPLASWADTWFVAPCQSWSVPARKPAVVNGSKSPAMLMVLDTTLDPSTTYAGSLAVRRLFPKAVLVQSGATPAGSATATSCSPGASIAEYLLNGTLPTRVAGNTADLKCPANALPDPTAATASTSAGTSKSTAPAAPSAVTAGR